MRRVHHSIKTLDERDSAILAAREAAFAARTGPRIGDWVVFSDGVERLISYDWGGEEFQTSDGGSFHLGSSGHLSFSGSLFGTVPAGSLSDTGEVRGTPVWFFHHDFMTAHNGVDAFVSARVYRCSLPAPS